MFSTQLARVLNKTMLQRQEKLFKLIVEEYLKTGTIDLTKFSALII